ncbi:MAG: succinate dehydrogenase cytochrome b subunit [Bacteroidales bacterium]
MTTFFKFASVTKKITLAIVGVFLMIFLLVHAGINLCLLRGDEGVWFRAAAHFMGTNYIVKVFEIVLFAAFFVHIILALILQFQNWRARPVAYKVANRSATRLGSKYMIYTGILVAIFLCIHMMNFYFVKLGWAEGKYIVKIEDITKADPAVLQQNQDALVSMFQNTNPETQSMQQFKEEADNVSKAQITKVFGTQFKAYEPDFYNMARQLFKNTFYSLLYIVLIFALGIHLNHAFSSAFQTIGWNHPKYTPFINGFGTGYAIVITLMFCIIPVWFLIY